MLKLKDFRRDHFRKSLLSLSLSLLWGWHGSAQEQDHQVPVKKSANCQVPPTQVNPSTKSQRLVNMERLVSSLPSSMAKKGSPLPTTSEIKPKPEQIFYVDYQDLVNKEGKLLDYYNEEQLAEAIKSGLVKVERVPAGAMVKFIYNKGMINDIVRSISSLKLVSKIAGRYNNSSASEKDIIKFVRDILHIDLNSDNFQDVNKQFQVEYGMGLDEYFTINQIFSRKLTADSVHRHLEKLSVRKGDAISNSTARLRIIPHVDVNESFHLTDKNIGGKTNQFSVRRLFGIGGERDLDESLEGEHGQALLKKLQEMGKSTEGDSEMPLEAKNLTDPLILNFLVSYLKGSTMLVNRLAPEDYHHVHFPFTSGKVLTKTELLRRLQELNGASGVPGKSLVPSLQAATLKIFENIEKNKREDDEEAPFIHIDGRLLSVSTLATTSQAVPFNPLTENMRDIIFIDSPDYGIVPMAIIGATGVGKNVINIKAGQEMSAGDNIGHFEFGASTVVMFLPQGSAEPYPDTAKMMNMRFEVPLSDKQRAENAKAMAKNKISPHPVVIRQMETLVEMGTPLFKPAHSTAD